MGSLVSSGSARGEYAPVQCIIVDAIKESNLQRQVMESEVQRAEIAMRERMIVREEIKES